MREVGRVFYSTRSTVHCCDCEYHERVAFRVEYLLLQQEEIVYNHYNSFIYLQKYLKYVEVQKVNTCFTRFVFFFILLD